MTLNEIVTRAASVYPDTFVLNYYDTDRQCAVESHTGGDTLAAFISWELYETFDPEANDEEQLKTAIEKMRSAEQDLRAVVTALENMARERRDLHGRQM